MKNCQPDLANYGQFKTFVMQISIQSLEITYHETPYRFIVKRVFNTSRNEISYQCWAPDDNSPTKELIENQVLTFEWDHQQEDFRYDSSNPVSEKLKEAIREQFRVERA